MRARCGSCGTEVEIMGAAAGGQFRCPACGALNRVAPVPPVPVPEPMEPAVQPVDDSPSPRTSCPACSFSFIVGEVDQVICPNCRSDVDVADV